MKGMAKRVGDLEARAGDLSLAHLNDSELRDWLGVTLRQIGPALPDGAMPAFEAGNWTRLMKELEAVQCD